MNSADIIGNLFLRSKYVLVNCHMFMNYM